VKPEKRRDGFIVEADTPGLTVSGIEHKMGQRASQTAEMSFVDVRVPAENVLGGEGNGMRVAFNSLDNGRIGIAALATGLAQAALEESLKYAKERQAFGQSISEFQAIQFKLADMATQTEIARLLTLRAAALKDAGSKQTGYFASMAKLYASRRRIKCAPMPCRFTAATAIRATTQWNACTAMRASRLFTKARAKFSASYCRATY
jgi:alkylation response protein AidB-like acyl-CoA dehydrogenase